MMIDKPVTRERAEAALHFLAHSDIEVATLKVAAKRGELAFKRTKAAIFKIADGSVADRNALAETASEGPKPVPSDITADRNSLAETASETVAAEEAWLAAELEYEGLRNQRSTAVLVFEMFRSLEASRRQGSQT